MDTCVSIIDKVGSKVSDETNVRLLWAAMLFSETINSSSNPLGPINILLEYSVFPERQKFMLYVDWLKTNPANSEDGIAKLETYFSKIVSLRSKKGKTKELLVLHMQGEQRIKGYFEDYKNFMHSASVLNKTAALFPLSCSDSDNWTKPMLVWTFPDENTEIKIKERIKVLSQSITEPTMFPFFDSLIQKKSASAKMESGKRIKDVNFISDLLFEIPEPFSLTTSQINLVRNDFNKISRQLFDEMVKLNEAFKDIPFSKINFEKTISMYQEKIAPLKPAIQKTADENSCLSELKKQNPVGKVYRVYAGISSFAGILNFYKALDIIDENDVAYIREDMSTRAGINNSRIFLFLDAVDK